MVKTVVEFAEEILDAAGRPLHVEEITERALAAGWPSAGKTPRATIESRLAMSVKERGDGSPFVRVAPRTYALRAWPDIVAAPTRPALRAGLMTYLDAAEKVLT